MALDINTRLFAETGTDSDALNVLGTLVHRFPDEGEYVASVTRGGDLVGEELLVVDDEYHARQATIDLASVGSPLDDDRPDCTCEGEDYQCIRPDGFGVFHVGRGRGGYSVRIDPLAERDVREFDSGELDEYDRFAAGLLRPGTYVVRNRVQGVTGEVEVAYPDPDADRPDEPVTVTATESGFEPTAVEMVPGQGLVFDVQAPSHLQIELEQPHERATADPDEGAVGRQARADPHDQARVNPDDLSIADLQRELSGMHRRNELRSVLLAERASKNRDGAIEAIRARLEEVSGPE